MMSESGIKDERVEIKITGMSCNHCVEHIEEALLQTKGVSSVHVDLASATAYIEHDSSVISAETLLQVIQETGYEAVLSEG